MKKLILLITLVLGQAMASQAALTWYWTSVPSDPNIANQIAASMDAAVNSYNTYSDYTGAVPVNYNAGVPTAQASYQGWVTFGGSRNYRTALHELSHWMGAGTYGTWNGLRDGRWIGTYANATLQAYDGPGERIGCDSIHFWPYGWNFDNEGVFPERNIGMVGALRRDMGLSDMTIGIAPGTYRVRNRGTLKMLDNGGSIADGAQVMQFENSTGTSQRWTVTLLSGGYFSLQCVSGGRYLDSLGNVADGSPIGQSAASASTSQQWQIVQTDSGYFKIINRANGKCLDAGGQTADGTGMQNWTSDSSLDQQWKFVSTTVVTLPAAGVLSQGQPVASSSNESGNDNGEGNDGAVASRWTASSGTYPQWWRVDLGSIQPITKVVINWSDLSPRSYRYRIETSDDDISYTVAVDKTGNTVQGTTTDIFAATARYVRVTVTGATTGWAAFWECRVYNETAPLQLVSQYRPATSSSSQGGNLPVNSNDGDNTFTRWTASSATYPQWWRVDLGSIQPINRAVITWFGGGSRASQYKIETSTDGSAYTLLLDKSSNTTPGTTTDNFSAHARYVRVTATGVTPAGGSASFYECNISSLVSSPWLTTDVGAVGAAGSFTLSDGVFTIQGSGADIGGTGDEFRYVYQEISGDFSITARVSAIDNTDPWAKAGVMIRETTNANSSYVINYISPGNGVAFEQRSGTSDSASSIVNTAGLTAPYWVRLVRAGNNFTAYRSLNSTTWTLLGTTAIAMNNNCSVGLAVCSANDGTLNQSTFDNVSITLLDSPGAVSNLTATAGNGFVGLQWPAAVNATVYNVKRATVSGGPYITVASAVADNLYVNTGLVNGTTYYYVVAATNAFGEGAVSPEAAATPGLVPAQLHAWLRFDETSGTTAADSTGHGWNGVLINSPGWVAGYSNNAVNLAGASSQHVTLPAGALTNLFDFSIACWVRQDTIGTWSRIFDLGTGTSVNMFLTPRNGANNVLRFAITTGGGGGEQRIDSAAALPAGIWKHVAVTLSGSVGILYVDGTPVGTNSSMTSKPANLGITTLNYLGRSQYSDPYFNGQMDDFRIYRGTLTAGEVTTFLIPLAAPTGLAATPGDGEVALKWNAAERATGYNIFRSIIISGPYELVANTTTTNWMDAAVSNGTLYHYVLSSTNGVGESGNLTLVSARPVSAMPPPLVSALTGGQLQLKWPESNRGWRLGVQTNTLSAGLGTNWTTIPGSSETNQFVVPLGVANGSVFFRLIYP
jgi:regulation of enolase protein 1 (concanavalin A-like superfamily)